MSCQYFVVVGFRLTVYSQNIIAVRCMSVKTIKNWSHFQNTHLTSVDLRQQGDFFFIFQMYDSYCKKIYCNFHAAMNLIGFVLFTSAGTLQVGTLPCNSFPGTMRNALTHFPSAYEKIFCISPCGIVSLCLRLEPLLLILTCTSEGD